MDGAMTALGESLLGALAIGLGVERRWFAANVTAHPTTLFRIFHYPARLRRRRRLGRPRAHRLRPADDPRPGRHARVCEVHAPDGWIAVPPDPRRARRQPRRHARTDDARPVPLDAAPVRNTFRTSGRLSLPFFLDPVWDATPVADPRPAPATRWDARQMGRRRRPRWHGTYGDYLTAKVRQGLPGAHVVVAPSWDMTCSAKRSQPSARWAASLPNVKSGMASSSTPISA